MKKNQTKSDLSSKALARKVLGLNSLLLAAFLVGGAPSAAGAEPLSQSELSAHATAKATKNFKIKQSVGPNGAISPKGTKSFRAKSKAEYTITPKKGYFIDTLTVNGATPKGLPKTKGKPYNLKIAKVSENLTIVATFAQQRTIRPLALGSQMSVVDPK